jgi:hypothetical protein
MIGSGIEELERTIGRLRWALAGLHLAVVFLGGAVTCAGVRTGHPVLAGGCALLSAGLLALLPVAWRKTR